MRRALKDRRELPWPSWSLLTGWPWKSWPVKLRGFSDMVQIVQQVHWCWPSVERRRAGCFIPPSLEDVPGNSAVQWSAVEHTQYRGPSGGGTFILCRDVHSYLEQHPAKTLPLYHYTLQCTLGWGGSFWHCNTVPKCSILAQCAIHHQQDWF